MQPIDKNEMYRIAREFVGTEHALEIKHEGRDGFVMRIGGAQPISYATAEEVRAALKSATGDERRVIVQFSARPGHEHCDLVG